MAGASVAALDLERLDAAVDAAIEAGEPGDLRVIGYGEITLAIGWPSEEPSLAVKRLPAFPSRAAFERYADLFGRYLAALEERAMLLVPTELVNAARPNGDVHAYLVQPLVERSRLLNNMLRTADPDEALPLLRELAAVVARAVDARVGVDAQASNWLVDADGLRQLDLSTPMMRTPDGRHELDASIFIAIYPWLLRRPLRPVAASVMAQYHDPRTVLVDVASNFIREDLERWLPALLAAANEHVRAPITEAQVRRYFARDKRLWLLMQRLRRTDRAWQRRVRRRPYPFLLPPPYRYGPQELP